MLKLVHSVHLGVSSMGWDNNKHKLSLIMLKNKHFTNDIVVKEETFLQIPMLRLQQWPAKLNYATEIVGEEN